MRTQIMTELKKQEWAPHPSINVIVRDGVAELWGTLLDEKKRDAVRVVAENVPGIVGVQDHMVWVEPTSGIVLPPPG
jgi:osmotically-inducible protein OsmY